MLRKVTVLDTVKGLRPQTTTDWLEMFTSSRLSIRSSLWGAALLSQSHHQTIKRLLSIGGLVESEGAFHVKGEGYKDVFSRATYDPMRSTGQLLRLDLFGQTKSLRKILQEVHHGVQLNRPDTKEQLQVARFQVFRLDMYPSLDSIGASLDRPWLIRWQSTPRTRSLALKKANQSVNGRFGNSWELIIEFSSCFNITRKSNCLPSRIKIRVSFDISPIPTLVCESKSAGTYFRSGKGCGACGAPKTFAVKCFALFRQALSGLAFDQLDQQVFPGTLVYVSWLAIKAHPMPSDSLPAA